MNIKKTKLNKADTVEVDGHTYTQKRYRRFVRDMESAGLTPYHYKGRFYYEGPAVNCGNIQEALSKTKVKCQWDNMGKGFVVYPS